MPPRAPVPDAARRLFRRRGFCRSAIAPAAGEAGPTRQARDHHFSSKEAASCGAVERLYEQALAAEAAAAIAAILAVGNGVTGIACPAIVDLAPGNRLFV